MTSFCLVSFGFCPRYFFTNSAGEINRYAQHEIATNIFTRSTRGEHLRVTVPKTVVVTRVTLATLETRLGKTVSVCLCIYSGWLDGIISEKTGAI